MQPVSFACLALLLLGAWCPPIAVQAEVRETHYTGGALHERFEIDAEGRKAGLYERFREDGSIEQRAHYLADNLHGESTEFDATGQPVSISHFARGLRQGSYEQYAGGRLVQRARFVKDKLDGRLEAFDENGDSILVAEYRAGELNGKFIEMRPAEDWKRTAKYKAGRLDGNAKIEVKGKTISKRVWVEGRLAELDGNIAFPTPFADLYKEWSAAALPAPVDPSDLQSAARQGELARLKTYRALCGLPWRDLVLVPEWNDLCDAAGELLHRIGRLDHTPAKPEGMDEEAYRRGYQGTSNSNLASGGLRGSVDMYMDDSDASNIDRIGHRRWCLNPAMQRTGFGSKGQWAAMWSMDSSGPGVKSMEAVLYPPRGYTPVDMFGPRHAWSIQVIKGKMPADKESIVVHIFELDHYHQAIGEALPLDYKDIEGGGFGGLPCVAFRPGGLVVQPGRCYRAQVSFDGGKTLAYDYVVEFCPALDKLDPELVEMEGR
ncbi:MAG: hypothetical protein R3F33_06745 [Planctomycetota bacterium]